MDNVMLLAAKIKEMAARHEESWVSDPNEKYKGKYTVSLNDLAYEDPISYPAYLLLKCAWNDALDWADNPSEFME